MKFEFFMSIALIVILFSSAFLITIPNSNKAYALNTDVFLKSITRIPGGSVFNVPLSIALDSSANIYVADSGNYRVAEFDHSGTLLKAFGTSGSGELNTTSSVAVDSSGNVYAADSDNNQIVEFSNSGSFIQSFGTTGTGKLSSPSGVAVDSSGNVYAADTGNSTIAQFSNSGSFIKSFGSGTLSSPSGVAVDSSGNVYAADTGDNQIVEFSNSGSFIQSFGSGTLSSPSGVAVDSSGNVYAADTGDNQIVEFSNSGSFIKSFGSGTLSSPSGVAVDSSGNVYAADTGDNQIVEFSNSGSFIQSFGTTGSLVLSGPSNVALNSNGDIFVADDGNNRILAFDNVGNFLFSFGTTGTGNGQFTNPFGMAFDSSGNIYVADTNNNRVEKFNSTGGFLSSFGSGGSGGGNLNQPLGIAIGNAGNIFVADTNNARIAQFSNSGSFIQSIGVGTLNKPTGVVFNAAGNLYVSDRGNNKVYEFSVSGSRLNILPNANSTGISFHIPYGIGFDFPGNVHVVDSGNNRVVVLSPTGQVVTQFGSVGSGTGQFDLPEGLAIDASGNIYVADSFNNRVEIFSPTVPPSTTITMNNPTPSSVRWGIDSVSISGHATSIPIGGTITVNWGDGSTTSNIPVSTFTGNWGPVTHTYPATTSGQTEQMIGTVVSSGNTVLATSLPVSVSVIAHHTSLTIGNILNVLFGGPITASGVLTDTDANTGISNAPISFSGSGIASLLPVTTASDGSYSSTGTIINSITSGLQVTASFAGNSQYISSSATTSPFSTNQHHVALYLKSIPNSPWSSTITISGTLNDTDAGNVGVNGESVIIGGNGITSPQTITTSTISGKAGSFSTTASTPNNVATGLTVTATFNGDHNYIAGSSSTSYNAIAHSTSLTLNSISNVVVGGTITASGTLKDVNTNVGIVGATITFNGTGLGTISSTSTSTGGSYSSQGNAPNSVLSGLGLQAHYAGSTLYQNANSTIQTYSTGNAPSVSINTPVIPNTLGNNKARWGIDPVSINGTVSNSATGDTISINWGDSSSSNGIAINSGKWGPLSHTYGAGAVGTNHIVATLFSSSAVNRTSSAPLSIFVVQHQSALTLNPISDVGVGGTFTVTGRLTDADANMGIGGQSVTFTGTGVGTLAAANTNATGYYTATGTAPNSQITGLTLQAIFAGDLDIFSSSSTIQTYNTIAITSPPEGFNQFDPVSKDVLVYGVDSTGKIFGPIKPQTVTTTSWGYDDDEGGDQNYKTGSQQGDDSYNTGSHYQKGYDRYQQEYDQHQQGYNNQYYSGNDQHQQGNDDHHNTGYQYQQGTVQYYNIDYQYKGGSQQGDDDHNTGSQHQQGDDNHNTGDQHQQGDDDHNTGHQYQERHDNQYYPGNDHECDGLTAQLRTFNIVDSAGNSLVLVEKVVKSNNEINVHVISLQYNKGPVLSAPINLKHFAWSLDNKGNIQELDQTMIVGKFILPTTVVNAEYTESSGQTQIQVQQYYQHPQNIVKNGLDLIKMLTSKGSLTIGY